MPAQSAKTLTKAETWRQTMDLVAIAAVRMENDEYTFPAGVPRGPKREDGTREWNKQELMRLAGYKNAHDTAVVIEDEHFKRMVEYQRWRRMDPNFRRDRIKNIWAEIGDEALIGIYETVKFHPDSMNLEQKIKVVKMVIDAIGNPALSGRGGSRSKELLEDLPPAERKALLDAKAKALEKRLEETRSLQAAHEGADDIEEQYDAEG